MPTATAEPISVRRVRIGVLLFLLWWLPFYLLAPAIARRLGYGDDAQARRAVTVAIVCIQTVLGVLGAYLAGKELLSTLGKVRRRRLLPTAWRIVWSGDTDVPAEDLRETGPEPPVSGSVPAARPHHVPEAGTPMAEPGPAAPGPAAGGDRP